MNKILIWGLSAIFIFSCAGTNELQKKYSQRKSTLGYLNDSGVTLNNVINISDYIISDEVLPNTDVKNLKSLVLPFLLYNQWNHEFLIRLGENGTGGSFKDFGRESLLKDLKNAGARIQENPEFDIKVNIKKIRSETDYYESGFFYFFFIAYGYGGINAVKTIDSQIEAEIIISHNGLSKNIDFSHHEKAIVPNGKDKKEITQDIINGMVETLSICFKELNIKIISSI